MQEPLVTGTGIPLGTFGVLDYAPRPGLSSEQAEILMVLARQGTILLEYRRALRRLSEQG